ncbi:glycosyltransferase [Suilimivivens aceti]|uniref:Glycosyltransferase n=1 Tax=Suilimivivens aceti TaxID=2981774 RepID=A0ABT2SZD1_9FIRM|nr:glycosyltransferase [Suilimivivens aceti]MCU6743021.1 glycosyltransferase [Suilimivivens aceti]
MMKREVNSINLLFPVLNERLRLQKGIETTIAYVREQVTIPCKLTILDNGSEDETPEIGKKLEEAYPEVTYVRVGERGVGVAFRKGIELNDCDIVGYMDIDLSTDLKYLGKTIEMFQQDPELQYVNGTRFSKESDTKGRKWYRKITSMGLVFLLKTIFHMKATDALCGFTFLRKEEAEQLVAESSQDNGWFYTVEFLLRAERDGMKICDMPVEWQEDYNTTVKVFKTIKNYIIQIHRLRKALKSEKKGA